MDNNLEVEVQDIGSKLEVDQRVVADQMAVVPLAALDTEPVATAPGRAGTEIREEVALLPSSQ